VSNTTGSAAAFAAVDARRRWSRGRAATALGIVATAMALGAQAQSNAFVPNYTGTLKKIAESGVVRIGHRENSPPFAVLDTKKMPVGYSLDLCELVVEEIVAELAKDSVSTGR
jgi:glutamate/aspartate transport system substrate-binding protein